MSANGSLLVRLDLSSMRRMVIGIRDCAEAGLPGAPISTTGQIRLMNFAAPLLEASDFIRAAHRREGLTAPLQHMLALWIPTIVESDATDECHLTSFSGNAFVACFDARAAILANCIRPTCPYLLISPFQVERFFERSAHCR